MVGWILVLDTPYFAYSSATGQPPGGALLAQVPAGSYQLRTWHPGLPVGAPALTQPLAVDADAGETRAAVRLTGLTP